MSVIQLYIHLTLIFFPNAITYVIIEILMVKIMIKKLN